jgi:hypothetical protein
LAFSRNRIAWTYTDDTGQHWRVNAVKAYTDQNKLGGSPAAESVPPLPKWLRPRRIQLTGSNLLGVLGRRSVIVYSTNAPILTHGVSITMNREGSRINQDNYYNRHYPHTVLVPERRPRKGTVTRISA